MVTILRTRGDRSIRSFIDAERGTISREIYVNPEIFEQEMEQIFQRCWLFLGHESQIPNPGDFIISRMGTEEVIVVRDRKDKQIRAFLNSCRHRGDEGVPLRPGQQPGVHLPLPRVDLRHPGQAGRAPASTTPRPTRTTLDKEEWGLVEVAQFKNFYGSLWATWDRKAPSFEDYLGPFAESLRHCLQSSDGEDGGLEMFTPFQRHRLPTNWKVPGFTSVTDLTHTAMTHRSAAAARRCTRTVARATQSAAKPFPQEKYAIGDHNLGPRRHVHLYKQPGVARVHRRVVRAGRRRLLPRAARQEGGEVRRPDHAAARLGWRALLPSSRAVMVDSWRLRWYHPHEVGHDRALDACRRRQECSEAREGRPASLLRALQRPVGFFESDDMENWNYVYPASQGAQRAQARLLLRQRAWAAAGTTTGFPGVVVNGSYTEEAHRARFSRWLAFMEAKSWDDLYPVNKIGQPPDLVGEALWLKPSNTT